MYPLQVDSQTRTPNGANQSAGSAAVSSPASATAMGAKGDTATARSSKDNELMSAQSTESSKKRDPSRTDEPVDSDSDGLVNSREDKFGTNPNDSDSDGDGVPDSVEVRAGSDPTNANSKPGTGRVITDTELERTNFYPVRYELRTFVVNRGDSPQTYRLSLETPNGTDVTGPRASNGTWDEFDDVWYWRSIEPGVTERASGRLRHYEQGEEITLRLKTEGRVVTTVLRALFGKSSSLKERLDTNDDGTVQSTELLDLIVAWADGETPPGISDELDLVKIQRLISRWAEGKI